MVLKEDYMKGITKLTIVLFSAFMFQSLMAEETVAEKAEYAKDKTVNAVKKGYRATKDAVCMKGDIECAAQEAKHGIQNTADTVKAETKKTVNKLDK